MKQRKSFIIFLYLGEAYLLLHLSKFLIHAIPFKKLSKHLGSQNTICAEKMPNLELVSNFEFVISRASKKTLFTSKCYDKALTALIMLRIRNLDAKITFGVKIENSMLIAHAWVYSGHYCVTGKEDMSGFNQIISFSN